MTRSDPLNSRTLLADRLHLRIASSITELGRSTIEGIQHLVVAYARANVAHFHHAHRSHFSPAAMTSIDSQTTVVGDAATPESLTTTVRVVKRAASDDLEATSDKKRLKSVHSPNEETQADVAVKLETASNGDATPKGVDAGDDGDNKVDKNGATVNSPAANSAAPVMPKRIPFPEKVPQTRFSITRFCSPANVTFRSQLLSRSAMARSSSKWSTMTMRVKVW